MQRSPLLESRNFALVIALAVVGVFALLSETTEIFERIELRTVGLYVRLKPVFAAVDTRREDTPNPRISADIRLIGVDDATLARLGDRPLPRYHHASLVDRFTHVQDSAAREHALALDFALFTPSANAVHDALLRDAMRANGRVFLTTLLDVDPPDPSATAELFDRHDRLFETAGRIEHVRGPWQTMPAFFGLRPPLQPFAAVAAGYGHANVRPDSDGVVRRQPLIAKSSELIHEYRYEELTAGFTVDESAFERLVWFDRKGGDHTIATPLTERGLEELALTLERKAAPRGLETDGDGEIDGSTFVVRHYREHFIPSIALALATSYFNKTPADLAITLGEAIVIRAPERFDAGAGRWVPYRILIEPARYEHDDRGRPVVDANGDPVVARDAVYRTPREIRIPIDERGMMLINFVGRRSGPAHDRTFAAGAYHEYVSDAPGPDPGLSPTIGAEHALVIAGALLQGPAGGAKPTPYGAMYGVEIQANALNTIVMDDFITDAPWWLDLAILATLAVATALVGGRLPVGFAAVGCTVLVVGYFCVASAVFAARNFALDFASPALAIALILAGIAAYRAMTAGRHERRLRDLFRTRVNPALVTAIVQRPPELGGAAKDLTVLFSNIRGFTTLPAAITPEESVQHLNRYLTAMTDIVIEYRGTLGRYAGNEIVCFWGAPLPQEDHALLACRGALRQLKHLHELNARRPGEHRMDITVGINSGVTTVGSIGAAGRANYTPIGRNVDLGARLEGANRRYGTNIIISETTYRLVKDHVVARELDSIRVTGYSRPVVIYELVDMIGDGVA